MYQETIMPGIRPFEASQGGYATGLAEYFAHPEKFRLEPFCIFGNLYYVGDRKVTSHLIDTGDGLILFDTGYGHTTHMMLDSIRGAGFDPMDIKIIIHSHGHFDHFGSGNELRKLTGAISKTNTTCIFINQLREKIGVMFGNPETTTGGNALKFYASVRIDIRRTSVIKDGDEQLGTRTKVKVVKNKVAPPFKKAEFDIMFGEGISKMGEIIDLGVDYEIIRKSGSWFSYGDKKIGQGRDAVKEALKNDPALMEEIELRVREAMREGRE